MKHVPPKAWGDRNEIHPPQITDKKRKMKDNATFKDMLWIAILLIMMQGINGKWHKGEMDAIADNNAKMDTLMVYVQKRDYLDSLYREHLSECSYLDKKSVYVSNQGFLKTSYYNGKGAAK